MIDIVMETGRELFEAYVKSVFEKDEALKATRLATFKDETGPKTLGSLEKLMTGKFAVGKMLTDADIFLYATLEMVNLRENLEKKYPKLEQNRRMVESLPRVRKYLDNRPDTTM